MNALDKQAKAKVIAQMMTRTADVMEVTVREIINPKMGSTKVSRARQAFCYLVKPMMCLHEVGAILGRRAAGTVDSAWRNCLKNMQKDELYRAKVNMLIDEFEHQRDVYRK